MHQKIMAVSMSNSLCIIIQARRIETKYKSMVSHEMDGKKKNIYAASLFNYQFSQKDTESEWFKLN